MRILRKIASGVMGLLDFFCFSFTQVSTHCIPGSVLARLGVGGDTSTQGLVVEDAQLSGRVGDDI